MLFLELHAAIESVKGRISPTKGNQTFSQDGRETEVFSRRPGKEAGGQGVARRVLQRTVQAIRDDIQQELPRQLDESEEQQQRDSESKAGEVAREEGGGGRKEQGGDCIVEGGSKDAVVLPAIVLQEVQHPSGPGDGGRLCQRSHPGRVDLRTTGPTATDSGQ